MAAVKNLISAEDLYRLELIDEVRLSPDGTQAFFTKKRVDCKTEKKFTNLPKPPTTLKLKSTMPPLTPLLSLAFIK